MHGRRHTRLELATWAVAEGRATAERARAPRADPVAWRRTLDRLHRRRRGQPGLRPRAVRARSASGSSRTSRTTWPGSAPSRAACPTDRRHRPRRPGRSRRSWAGSSCRPRGPRGRSWCGPAGRAPPRPPTTSWPTCSRRSAGPPSAGACTPTSLLPVGRPGRGAGHPGQGVARLAGRGRWRLARRRRRRQRRLAGPGRPRSAVRLVARGAVVPTLRTRPRRRRPGGRPVGRLGAGAGRRAASSTRWPPPCPAPVVALAPRPPRERPRAPCSARWSTPS